MKATIAIMPGEGIGQETMNQALRVLDAVSNNYGHKITAKSAIVDGSTYESFYGRVPESFRTICSSADALFLSPSGTNDGLRTSWNKVETSSLVAIRNAFDFSINIKSVRIFPGVSELVPPPHMRGAAENGVDMLFVTELHDDEYFLETKRFVDAVSKTIDTDLCSREEMQVRRTANFAFKAALSRTQKLTAVDQTDCLETLRLWREVIKDVASDYPHVSHVNFLVDNCAMQIVKNPFQFDVILTSNALGDILTDAAVVLPGSPAMVPSASFTNIGLGLYEPTGTLPRNESGEFVPNPIAQILTLALLLRYSLNLSKESLALERAVHQTLADGFRTEDIYESGKRLVDAFNMTSQIISRLPNPKYASRS